MPFAARPPRQEEMKDWDVESAIATYNVDGWGGGYFTVNAEGNVVAKPLQENGGSITILEVVNEARSRGLSFPLVIRFQDLLRHRVEAGAEQVGAVPVHDDDRGAAHDGR